ncbi:S-geranylgeranyl-glutathione receptor P2RY8-like [Petromyzon marinus]|uniref:P2Y purinoceptor 8-like n=1 Tax=Petromyzon marinus TaxID=7757 RepID=A0AAJ7SS33_PETMA|nr:P2Y purinoceptor 8-like [Petromyzon marinus]
MMDNSSSNSTVTLDDFTTSVLTGRLTTMTLPAIYIVILLVGLPTNVSAFWMLCGRIRASRSASSTNIYMMNLAAVDLLFLAFLPLQIAYHLRGNDWPFGRPLCHLVTTLLYLNTHCSIFFLTCISVDRYLAVVHPHRAQRLRGARTAVAASACTWVIILLFASPLHFIKLTMDVPQLGITTCYDVFPKMGSVVSFFQTYCVVFFACVFLVPFSVTVFCYLAIIRSLLLGSSGNGGAAASKGAAHVRRHAAQLSVVVLATFVTCFAPCNCVLLAHSLMHRVAGGSNLYGVYKLCLAFSSLNTCFDPLVYYCASAEFRRRLRSALRCRRTSDETSRSFSEAGKPSLARAGGAARRSDESSSIKKSSVSVSSL